MKFSENQARLVYYNFKKLVSIAMILVLLKPFLPFAKIGNFFGKNQEYG